MPLNKKNMKDRLSKCNASIVHLPIVLQNRKDKIQISKD